MQLSISQISKYLECPRRWWFDRVIRMPGDGADTKSKYSRAFGSILHAVVERYLDADTGGRGKDGKPVNLYPSGWTWDHESGVRLTPEDEKVVQALVTQAIDQGILARQPGGKVEDEFFGILDAGPATPDQFCRGVIAITGKVDYQYGHTVEDHKTAKSTRYLKSEDEQSPKWLGSDPQLLLYAFVAGHRMGLSGNDTMTVRHNYYVKEPTPRVEERKATVTMAQCAAIWTTLREHGQKILPLAKKKDMNLWQTVPGAIDGAGDGPGACNSYGSPCPYLGICSRSESPTKYRLRMLRLKHPEALADTSEDPMAALSLKDKIAAQRAKATAKPAAAPAKAKPGVALAAAKAKAKAKAPEPEPEPEVEETPEEELEVEVEETPEEESVDVETESVDSGAVARDVLIGLRDVLNAAFPAE